ncbi:DUF6851 domain-containing protein, partial [Methylicorpusculum sp.]|uniref:DUF6851 domain-containing protein n=1 Tax=Methylicorpusculum sp. TaxID=2713644 RepID=UPI002AB83914
MNLIIDWNNIALDAIRAVGKLPFSSPDRERGGPPQVARSIGIIYTTVYDAWAAYDDIAKTTHSPTPRRPAAQRTDANRRKAVSQAAYRAIVDQFPPTIYAEPFRSEYESALNNKLISEGITVGDANTNTNNPV